MNYLELIRGFWRSHEEHSFSTTEIAVYFYLLEVCNICRWKNPFKRNNAKIEADLCISYNTLKNARNKLNQCGLIAFKTKNGSPNVEYTLSNFDEVANEVSIKVSDEVTNEVANKVLPTKDKLNKNKTKNKNTPSGVKNVASKDATLKRKDSFYNSLVPFVGKYTPEMIRNFFNYWSEMNVSQTKMRFEKEKTWELSRRLATWANREDKFTKSKPKEILLVDHNKEAETKKLREQANRICEETQKIFFEKNSKENLGLTVPEILDLWKPFYYSKCEQLGIPKTIYKL